MSFEKVKSDRSVFLSRIYEVTGGNTEKPFIDTEIGMQLGFDPLYTSKLSDYLVKEGFISSEESPVGGSEVITHLGLKKVECEFSEKVLDFVEELKSELQKLKFDSEVNVNKDLEILVTQASAPKPDKGLIKEAVKSLRSVLESISAGLVTNAVSTNLPALIIYAKDLLKE